MTPLEIAIEALEEIADNEEHAEATGCWAGWKAAEALMEIKREQLLFPEKP